MRKISFKLIVKGIFYSSVFLLGGFDREIMEIVKNSGIKKNVR